MQYLIDFDWEEFARQYPEASEWLYNLHDQRKLEALTEEIKTCNKARRKEIREELATLEEMGVEPIDYTTYGRVA